MHACDSKLEASITSFKLLIWNTID